VRQATGASTRNRTAGSELVFSCGGGRKLLAFLKFFGIKPAAGELKRYGVLIKITKERSNLWNVSVAANQLNLDVKNVEKFFVKNVHMIKML
jgi:hypothetical protein